MIKARPEIIYVDTDVFSLKPMTISNPYLFGYETYKNEKSWRLNGAVLRLPAESQLLARMLEFMTETHPMPAWIPRWFKPQMQARFDGGDPMHIGEFPWGIWGPLGITALERETGEVEHAQSVDVFYPVPFPDRRFLFKRHRKLHPYLTENSATIHMWAPIKRLSADRYDGLCPPTRYAGQQFVKHGLDPALAPVPTTKRRKVSYE